MGTALVTGASSGLGEEFARQLAQRGHALVLVARDHERLAELAGELWVEHMTEVEVLPADLATAHGRSAVTARLADPDRPVDLLINNAGLGQPAGFVDNDVAAEVAAVEVMIVAVLELSHAAARAMKSRGRGAILNVASVAAYAPMGSYSAIKAWVLTFTEGLAGELHGSGVTATAVNPGLTRTEFHQRAQWDTDPYPSFAWLQAPDVVREALDDVARGKVVSTPSWQYKFAALASTVMPRPLVRRLTRAVDSKRH